jgi:hypothetical protein
MHFVQGAFLLDAGEEGGNTESVFICLFDENVTRRRLRTADYQNVPQCNLRSRKVSADTAELYIYNCLC